MTEITGISRTWEIFHQLEPEEVCSRVDATFDVQKGLYTTTSYGQNMYVDGAQRRVYSDSEEGEYLLSYTDYFFDLSVLWYLIGAQKKPLSGKLVKPSELEGGQIFVKGTHVLPLDEIAVKYNEREDDFFTRSRALTAKKYPWEMPLLSSWRFPKSLLHSFSGLAMKSSPPVPSSYWTLPAHPIYLQMFSGLSQL